MDVKGYFRQHFTVSELYAFAEVQNIGIQKGPKETIINQIVLALPGLTIANLREFKLSIISASIDEIKTLVLNLDIEYWATKQQRHLDNLTNFIYTTFNYDEFLSKLEAKAGTAPISLDELKVYALNRWYNYLTTIVVEYYFASHPNTTADANARNRFVDFTICGQQFDLKTSYPPKKWSIDKTSATLSDPLPLCEWFYINQSWTRFHKEPRLFLVMIDIDSNNDAKKRWIMKRMFPEIKSLVRTYLDDMPKHFPEITFTHQMFENPIRTRTDALYLIKDEGKTYGKYFLYNEKNEVYDAKETTLK